MKKLQFVFYILLFLLVIGCRSDKDAGETDDPLHNICIFPVSLQKALKNQIKKECSNIQMKDMEDLKKLTIEQITKASLLDKKYSSYFKSLEELDISNNPDMKEIPDFVYYIPNLKKLNISKTGVSNFSGKMCQLQQLTTLIATDNNYEGQEMPIAVFCLSQLRVLDMSNSSLRYIDEYIYYLRYLEELYLRSNELMNLPFVLHILPKLLVLDLQGNRVDYAPINTLSDCKNFAENSEEQQECQEEMKILVRCEYWHKLPFQRGKPFRSRYEDMTGEKYQVRGDCLECSHCYDFWLNDYVTYYDPEKSYLLDLTINGRTMRELRLVEDRKAEESHTWHDEHWKCEAHLKGISFRGGFSLKKLGDSLYHFVMPRNTSWGPSSKETNIERYRSVGWESPKHCVPINHNTPQPLEEAKGPWSEALPAVQAVIDKLYPQKHHCESWPTSFCPCKWDFGATEKTCEYENPLAEYYLGTQSAKKTDVSEVLRIQLEKEKRAAEKSE